jgi:hypothetical protein
MEPKIDLASITIGNEDDHMGGYEFTTSANDTITLSSLNYNNPGLSAAAGTYGPFTVNSGSNSNPWVFNPNASTKIKLDGADADIEINGISLLKTMQEIQIKLNILQPNTALEAEWEELYALGRKYRELEQQIKDKQATWDRLKAMPPPVID